MAGSGGAPRVVVHASRGNGRRTAGDCPGSDRGGDGIARSRAGRPCLRRRQGPATHFPPVLGRAGRRSRPARRKPSRPGMRAGRGPAVPTPGTRKPKRSAASSSQPRPPAGRRSGSGRRRDDPEAFAARFLFERRLWAAGVRHVAGVDEVGRGPLAGPVVACAVVLQPDCRLPGLDDSKRLTAAQRERLVDGIHAQSVAWCIAAANVEEIDRLNIAQAAFVAMRRALAGLGERPEHVLVDGFPIAGYGGPQTAIVGGDHLSNSIAAASVLAKVYRDHLAAEWEESFPGYGFARHKGYGTPEHLAALRRLGPCPLHRRSFHWDRKQLVLPIDATTAATMHPTAGAAAGATGGAAPDPAPIAADTRQAPEAASQ